VTAVPLYFLVSDLRRASALFGSGENKNGPFMAAALSGGGDRGWVRLARIEQPT